MVLDLVEVAAWIDASRSRLTTVPRVFISPFFSWLRFDDGRSWQWHLKRYLAITQHRILTTSKEIFYQNLSPCVWNDFRHCHNIYICTRILTFLEPPPQSSMVEYDVWYLRQTMYWIISLQTFSFEMSIMYKHTCLGLHIHCSLPLQEVLNPPLCRNVALAFAIIRNINFPSKHKLDNRDHLNGDKTI